MRNYKPFIKKHKKILQAILWSALIVLIVMCGTFLWFESIRMDSPLPIGMFLWLLIGWFPLYWKWEDMKEKEKSRC